MAYNPEDVNMGMSGMSSGPNQTQNVGMVASSTQQPTNTSNSNLNFASNTMGNSQMATPPANNMVTQNPMGNSQMITPPINNMGFQSTGIPPMTQPGIQYVSMIPSMMHGLTWSGIPNASSMNANTQQPPNFSTNSDDWKVCD